MNLAAFERCYAPVVTAASANSKTVRPFCGPLPNTWRITLAATRRATAEAVATKTQLEQLAAEFGGKDVKSRKGQGGGPDLTYIAIDGTIRRLNDVLGPNWSTSGSTTLEPRGEGQFIAFTELSLQATIDGVDKVAYGVGAMVNKDPDMAAKTALAEALKKAAHQLGVALYLWDADGRKRAEKLKALAGGSPAALKQEVFRIAKDRLGKDRPSAAEVAKVFEIKPGDLADDGILRSILEKEGLL